MRPTIAIMVVSLCFLPLEGCTVGPAGTAARPSQPQVQTQAARQEASDSERRAYAERQEEAANLEKFKGGNHGITILLVVVLVVLILYLLKVF